MNGNGIGRRGSGVAALTLAGVGLVAFAGATATVAKDAPAAAQAAKPADKAEKSLYERLGGVDAIALVVDDFVNNLAANPVVTANPKVKESFGKISVPGLKFKLVAQISDASGGPYKYHGRTMKDSHRGFKITEAEWDATVKTLKASLDKFKVPSKEQSDLIGAIAPMKGDIVGQ
jgi:hemoglobin